MGSISKEKKNSSDIFKPSFEISDTISSSDSGKPYIEMNCTTNSSLDSGPLPISGHSPNADSHPLYVHELSVDEEPWHAICNHFWVILYYNSSTHKRFGSIFQSTAEKLIQLKDKSQDDNDSLFFGRCDCAEYPSKTQGSEDPVVRIYHNGHFLDLLTKDCAPIDSDVVVAWIKENINHILFMRSGRLHSFDRYYCVYELNKDQDVIFGFWVVHFYNTSSPHHTRFTAHVLAAAEKFADTPSLSFAQRNCTDTDTIDPGCAPGAALETPYLQFYSDGDSGEEYHIPYAEGGADRDGLVRWIEMHMWEN